MLSLEKLANLKDTKTKLYIHALTCLLTGKERQKQDYQLIKLNMYEKRSSLEFLVSVSRDDH